MCKEKVFGCAKAKKALEQPTKAPMKPHMETTSKQNENERMKKKENENEK